MSIVGFHKPWFLGTLVELPTAYHGAMAHETTHILYEWEPFTEVEIAGCAQLSLKARILSAFLLRHCQPS